MNIDFHFGIIYIVARMGGLPAEQARVVAHACQYVDDATTDGPLQFADQQSFDRFASAHAMLDYRNSLQANDQRVWAPFHFLPSGVGDSLDEKLVCRPDSEPARKLVRHIPTAHAERPAGNDLHRLGVCLHAYVDTWAHQGFSGVMSARNRVRHLEGALHRNRDHWFDELTAHVGRVGANLANIAVDMVSRVGHGAALQYPDLPWVEWSYVNGLGERIERSNLPAFVEAADMTCRAIQAFVGRTPHFEDQPGLDDAQKAALEALMAGNTHRDPDRRLAALGAALSDGVGDVREALPAYIAKGDGSWKHAATGMTSADDRLLDAIARPDWGTHFEHSDYRKVHDAIKQHRRFVTDVLLVGYGIRLA